VYVCVCARVCVCVCVCAWERLSLPSCLSLSFVSDIRWLAECHTSSTVKVPAVWEHDVGEEGGSFDGEKRRIIVHAEFEQRSQGAARSLLEGKNEQWKGVVWEMRERERERE